MCACGEGLGGGESGVPPPEGTVWCAFPSKAGGVGSGVPSPGKLVGERPPYRKGGGGESGVPPLEAWMGEHWKHP